MDSGVEVRLAVPEIEAEMNTQEWAILTDVISNIGMSKVGAIGSHLKDDAESITGARPDKHGMSNVDAQGQVQEWGSVCWQMHDCTLTLSHGLQCMRKVRAESADARQPKKHLPSEHVSESMVLGICGSACGLSHVKPPIWHHASRLGCCLTAEA